MATVVEQNVTFRLASPEPPGLFLPSSLLELYQSRIGPVAVALWVNMRWMARSNRTLPSDEWIPALCEQMRTTPMQLLEAMDALLVYELLQVRQDREYVVQDPLERPAFRDRFGDRVADAERAVETESAASDSKIVTEPAAASAGRRAEKAAARRAGGDEMTAAAREASAADEHDVVGSAKPGDRSSAASRIVWDGGGVRDDRADGETHDSYDADLSAVMGMYHKKIGMIGPTQFEKLRWWVDEQAMSAEVIALAIEETASNAEMPTIQYLESVLRNWHNAGVRTFEDVLKRKNLSRSLRRGSFAGYGNGNDGGADRLHGGGRSIGAGEARGARFEGMANASAYEEADPDRLKRWKELYADE